MLWAFKRWKLISALAFVLMMAAPALGVVWHYDKPALPPSEPHNAIRVLGGGPAPFALDAHAAMLTD